MLHFALRGKMRIKYSLLFAFIVVCVAICAGCNPEKERDIVNSKVHFRDEVSQLYNDIHAVKQAGPKDTAEIKSVLKNFNDITDTKKVIFASCKAVQAKYLYEQSEYDARIDEIVDSVNELNKANPDGFPGYNEDKNAMIENEYNTIMLADNKKTAFVFELLSDNSYMLRVTMKNLYGEWCVDDINPLYHTMRATLVCKNLNSEKEIPFQCRYNMYNALQDCYSSFCKAEKLN